MDKIQCDGLLEKFFPPKTDHEGIAEALSLCVMCPVRKNCDELREISSSKEGIWAGKYYSDGKPVWT